MDLIFLGHPVLPETTLTISDSTGESLSMGFEIVRVVSLGTRKISEITRLKIRFSGCGYLNKHLNLMIVWSFELQKID